MAEPNLQPCPQPQPTTLMRSGTLHPHSASPVPSPLMALILLAYFSTLWEAAALLNSPLPAALPLRAQARAKWQINSSQYSFMDFSVRGFHSSNSTPLFRDQWLTVTPRCPLSPYTQLVSPQGFLALVLSTLGADVLCCGGCPVHRGVSSTGPGLYPLMPPPVVAITNAPRYWQMSPVEHHCFISCTAFFSPKHGEDLEIQL